MQHLGPVAAAHRNCRLPRIFAQDPNLAHNHQVGGWVLDGNWMAGIFVVGVISILHVHQDLSL